MASSLCLNDDTLGPAVEGCRGDFDFTQRFESVILASIPAATFVVLALLRVAWLSQQPRIVGGAALQYAKLAASSVSVAIALSILVHVTIHKGYGRDVYTTAAAALGIGAGLAVLALSYAEHSRAARPSTLLMGYMLIQILFDIAMTRTSWMVARSDSAISFAVLRTASVVFKAAILVLEAQGKARWLQWGSNKHSPEDTTGIFSLGTYFWLNRLLLRGYKGVLSIDDLYTLGREMHSELLKKKLLAQLEQLPHPGIRFGLAKKLAKALAAQLLYPITPRLILIGFKYSQPFFIRALLDHLQHPEAPRSIGYGLIGASVLIYAGIAGSHALYWYLHQRALCMSRGCLVAVIYKKATEAKAEKLSDGAVVTLMSTDVERVIRGFTGLHEFWASIVEISLGLWLLERELARSFMASIAVILVCVAMTGIAANYTGDRQSRWMAQIQERVGLTANLVSHAKYLRISSTMALVSQALQKMRVHELHAGNSFRWLLIATATAGFISNAVVPVVVFGLTSTDLDNTTIFTSFSYTVLLTAPLATLFQSVPALNAALTCLGRIQSFLEAEGRHDFRQFCSPVAPGVGFPLDVHSESDEEPSKNAWTQPVEDSVQGNRAPTISVVDGTFGWTREKMALKNISATVPASQLTFVVGPVGSGKSTLCKALLGEVVMTAGQVNMTSGQPVVGYCDQRLFLANSSVKENIIGYSQYNQHRYDEVTEACMLRPDFLQMTDGDNTKIGSNGIKLSGGQRQRVCLARALYLECDLLVLDDILSGLDTNTADEVFHRVFGLGGIIRRRKVTAVLCTHSARYLSFAHHIITLASNGTLAEEGSFSHLMQDKGCMIGLGVPAEGELGPKDCVVDEMMPSEVSRDKPASFSADLEEKSRQTGDKRVYGHYLQSMSTAAAVICFATGLLSAAFRNIPTIWMKYWAEDALHKPDYFYVGIFGLFKALQLLFVFILCIVVVIWMTTEAGIKLHQELLEAVVNAPLTFFTTTDLGIVVNLFSQDMTLIDGDLPLALLNTVMNGFDVIAMAMIMAVSSPYAAISYPVLLLVLYAVQRFYLRTSRQLRLLDLEAKSPLYGIETLRAFGWIETEITRNQQLLDTSQRPAYFLAVVQQWLFFTLQVFSMFVAVMVVTVATQTTKSNPGFAGASLITLMSWCETISLVIRYYAQLETSLGAVARIKAFSEGVLTEHLEGEDIRPPERWPESGSIEIRGVSVSYT
ncbi:hypothetical protein QQZ08_009239 [Neonectria magnoliae]|uniref:ABC transporter n=1 Tax=Neonectria magnoliae TaxID=2732573 RepID=A0ABR1HPG8_9HYPO